jgi:hypothetical protein
MMSSLANLRAALAQANSTSLKTLNLEAGVLEKQVRNLKSWVGSRNSSRPPENVTVAALNSFYRTAELADLRQAWLVCFGCIDPVLPERAKLIEDIDRFPLLLSGVDDYQDEPRAFRRCYRGLLHGYFAYDPDMAPRPGQQNWERLRAYLKDHVANASGRGWMPGWLETLHSNPGLLGDAPGAVYGLELVLDDGQKFALVRRALGIPDASWLVRSAVLGLIDAATGDPDQPFQAKLPGLLALLSRHPLAANEGLRRLLGRYAECSPVTLNPPLRDFAVSLWGNPWLKLNAAKWSLVADGARKMVADWLKLELIQRFFSLLAADGMNNTRRLKFWERYHASIDDMYFALGNTAYYHSGADFRDVRRKMEDRLLSLQKGGSPDNNAFIMCIGNHVVVEFGVTGNACFIFRREELPFSLSEIQSVNGNKTGLKGEPHVERLLHADDSMETWEEKFERTIAGLMSVWPGNAAPRAWTSGAIGASPPSGGQDAASRSKRDTEHDPAMSRQDPRLAILKSSAANLAERSRTLDEFCRERDLKVHDLRGQNGNLWVIADDTVGYVNSVLKSWGFTYKSGKGWWRK